MEKIITNTINKFLLKEGFYNSFKNRMKNGLNGFDTGVNYQRGVDLYSSKGSVMFYKFEEKINLFNEYVDYFNTYRGNHQMMLMLIKNVNDSYNIVMTIYQLVKDRLSYLNEGKLSNRLKGFYNGFKANRTYDRDEYQNNLDDEYCEQIKYHTENLSMILKNINGYSNNLWDSFGNNKNFENLIKNVDNFSYILQDLIEFINNTVLYKIENSIKQKLNNLTNDMLYDYDDFDYEDNKNSILDPYVAKAKSKLFNTSFGKKIRNYLDKQTEE